MHVLGCIGHVLLGWFEKAPIGLKEVQQACLSSCHFLPCAPCFSVHNSFSVPAITLVESADMSAEMNCA